MKLLIRAIFLFGLAISTIGCDRQGRLTEQVGLDRLEKGISTEAEVRSVMGHPDSVREEGGERRLEYPKGPAGHRTWLFIIGQDGKLRDYKQLLTEENFARIKPGLSKEEVRQMLGKPRSIMQFNAKQEEVWDWLYLESNVTPKVFNVHFDISSGKVVTTSSSTDAAQSTGV